MFDDLADDATHAVEQYARTECENHVYSLAEEAAIKYWPLVAIGILAAIIVIKPSLLRI